jgi:hypothetical protein
MSIDAMKQALEALEMLARYENPETKIQVRKPKDGGPIVTMYPHKVATEAATALRLAIEQAERQEPVAWRWKELVNGDFVSDWILTHSDPPPYATESMPLYTAPPQRQPLTEGEIVACIDDVFAWALDDGNIDDSHVIRFTRAIERAHGIGGGE